IQRVDEWLASKGHKLADFESWFYSESLNDLPLLERVTHPVAGDPDTTRHAQGRASRGVHEGQARDPEGAHQPLRAAHLRGPAEGGLRRVRRGWGGARPAAGHP